MRYTNGEPCGHKDRRNMIQGLYFGAILNYRSPVDGHLTRCVYVREENTRAVVVFRSAERVARVDFEQLEWAG